MLADEIDEHMPDAKIQDQTQVKKVISKPSSSKHKRPGQKKTVVERADDLLTTQEEHDHWTEILAACQKELETWVKLKCISRKLRKDARNIVDVRWVYKWKFDQETQGFDELGKAKAIIRRVIRARLCLRGFKDMDKDTVAKYAGTSQRYSQRVLCSEAVLNGWDLWNSDISKAFLHLDIR